MKRETSASARKRTLKATPWNEHYHLRSHCKYPSVRCKLNVTIATVDKDGFRYMFIPATLSTLI